MINHAAILLFWDSLNLIIKLCVGTRPVVCKHGSVWFMELWVEMSMRTFPLDKAALLPSERASCRCFPFVSENKWTRNHLSHTWSGKIHKEHAVNVPGHSVSQCQYQRNSLGMSKRFLGVQITAAWMQPHWIQAKRFGSVSVPLELQNHCRSQP